MAELLLEIGFEEMPAPWLSGLAEQLRGRFGEAAERERLEPGGVATFWTPRRLVLRAEIVPRQPDREEPVFGPALALARGADGQWTGAAQGFARKNGVTPAELGQGAKDPARPDELYLLHVRKVIGRESAAVLPALLMGVLRALSFPKRMSWDAWLDDGKGAFPFGRPIRWLVVLLDGAPVPLAIHSLAGGAKGPLAVASGNETRGHRFLPKGGNAAPVAVRSFAELRESLRERFVLIDPAERAARIAEGLAAAAAGARYEDHGLREEWRDLVEYPTVVVGQVPSEFRSLPGEVLETVLVHHQKYISLHEADGRIGRFAAVVNGDGAAAAEIVRGMERVVVARLRDAAFFLAEDRKRPLADRVPDLAGVSFHQGLGSYRDKSERTAKLVAVMARLGTLDATQARQAEQAARLAKADLVSLMVREFPELQGVIGGLYLAEQGAPAEVSEAVRWHYHPVALGPEAEPAAAFAGRDGAARVFAAVSLADKLDTLAGYFSLGETPTGSRDPFGLRRAAQGSVRAVLDFWRPRPEERVPDLGALLAAAVEACSGSAKRPVQEARAALELFLLERLEYVLSSRGFLGDEVAAVVHAPDETEAPPPAAAVGSLRALRDPLDALRRAEALQRVRREVPEDLLALAEAFKRAKNILAQAAPADSVEPRLFETEAERGLHEATGRLAVAAGSYEERLRGLATLRAPVSRFFDDVLVMAEDERVRGNRLALLRSTLSLFYRIADISKLGGIS